MSIALLRYIENISIIIIYFKFFKKHFIFIQEGYFTMVSFLVAHVFNNFWKL
jgi:hypothetical protein